ncbi:MAG TPA: right-handed parallel beta-helix repeat-containing protein [Phycisphaerae bacterium]|nr:right-handed parallel beta-helix repeat-containing protein [Phycisphaerae bacterium]
MSGLRYLLRSCFYVFLCFAAAPTAFAGTLAYVNAANTSGRHDGLSWATAYTSIQDALNSGATQIWVAQGTYSPGDSRDATFQLRTGIELYGGFAGLETQRNQRNWLKNKTILDGNGVYHVVTGADDAILDGFTITGGDGFGGPPEGPPQGPPPGEGGGQSVHTTPQAIMSGASNNTGAGMLNYQTAPTVRNCIFENNRAGKGGAVYNMTATSFPPRPGENSKAPVFINCIFRDNFAGGRGGGVSNDLGTAPIFLDCIFQNNQCQQKGGGMYDDFGCSPTLINCLFIGNSAQSAGGLGNDGGSSPVLYYCTFTQNHAVDYGAPLYQGTGPASNPSLVYCLIASNTCDWDDPGIYNWHDDTPLIVQSTNGDSGYKPGRFTEAQLPQLLEQLQHYRAAPAPEPFSEPPQEIPSSKRVVYVKASNIGNGDGRSWGSAYSSLQAALQDAGADGATVCVAEGTYQLGSDRSASFVLQPGERVYGGFSGNGPERDPNKYVTVLDGNHAYHVLVGANGAVLDGFIITGGYANGTGYDGQGGGLIDYQRGPQTRPNSPFAAGFAMTISHCAFRNNFAHDGGAVYSYDRARPVFTACVFAENHADNGGAVLDRVGVVSTFTNCEFIANSARWRGGALYFDYGSRPKLTGCAFRNNTTGGHGGAIFSVTRASQLENTIVTLTNCSFLGNSAKGYGGAANFHDSSIAYITDCTFTDNQAGLDGKAIAVTDNSTLQSQNNTFNGDDVYQQQPENPGENGPPPDGGGMGGPFGPGF